ncbi:MAG TPA: hypothetical protein PKE64_02240 [Anaerolineae bacterium]|nr:hypothetical protein [Anaerolineae bacterium]HMR62807.1 hypothetical protein [Anaerolineae bacterium]
MEINWTVVTLVVMGGFALTGFLRGWWKESVNTIFLGLLIFLLRQSQLAQLLIETLNQVLDFLWQLIPGAFRDQLGVWLEPVFGLDELRADAGAGATWFTILLLSIGGAILLSRFLMPSGHRPRFPYYIYSVTWSGAILGALLGLLNGWIITSLLREYLLGQSLPNNDLAAGMIATQQATAQPVVQALQTPANTILDSFVPWLVIIFGLFLAAAAAKSRVLVERNKQGFTKVQLKAPVGYQKIDLKG